MEISITWNICRVCLVEEEKKPQLVAGVAEPMRHIFDEDELLAKQIYECSGITMKPSDNLPEKICKKCYTLIRYAVNFRETCRASDVYLRNILQRTKSASAIFKKQQPPAEPLDEINPDDCLSVDNSDGDANETSVKLKRKASHSEKSIKQLFKDTEYSDLIEFENEECIADDDGTDNSEIILQLNTSNMQGGQLNEETEENQQSDEESFKQSNDEPILATSENEDEDNEGCYEQLEEFIAPAERNQRNMASDMESESGDGQAKVSSTVAIREDENEKLELKTEDTNLSSESNDMQTEYIVDEFLFDDNSRESISLQNSSVFYVHSKKVKSVANKYETHLDIATSSKPESNFQVWVCDICGNHFANRQILNAHIKVHRQEKNHECEICLKRFITACNLQAHMRIHTGEKPFECKYCERRFSDRSSNLRHERTHTNERPFECEQCGKAFSLGTTLKKHLKVHSGERSFRCDICDKSFKLPHQLKAHKNSILHKAVEQSIQVDQ